MAGVTPTPMPDRHDRDLLDSKQLCADYGFSYSWLAQSRVRGDGPPFLKIGANVRYRRKTVEEWINAQETTSTMAKAG